jgi:hypothetical protein
MALAVSRPVPDHERRGNLACALRRRRAFYERFEINRSGVIPTACNEREVRLHAAAAGLSTSTRASIGRQEAVPPLQMRGKVWVQPGYAANYLI